MIHIMNIMNLTLNLNKILQSFITQIIALEDMIQKLITATKNSFIQSIRIIKCDVNILKSVMTKQSAKCLSVIVHSVKTSMSVSILNLKLSYALTKFFKCQVCMIRNECFNCSQKEHTQKNCSTHSFDKIYLFLKLKHEFMLMTQPTNAIS